MVTHMLTRCGYFIAVTAVVVGTWSLSSAERTQPVYGFLGATSALVQGQIIRYDINLNTCRLMSGPKDQPEFADRFGGYVDHYRTINEKQPEQRTNLVFYQQKRVYNDTGRLAQLSREITIWLNNTARVVSFIYTADFGVLTYMYEHDCTMESTNQTIADVYLKASGSPAHLFNFDNISQALEQGSAITFSAIAFLCAGGRESTFSGIGGHITNYDVADENGVAIIDSTIASTVHYDYTSDTHMMDVLRMRMFDNRTIQFIDSRGRPPYMDPLVEHILHCFLEAGMPGGTVNLFSL